MAWMERPVPASTNLREALEVSLAELRNCLDVHVDRVEKVLESLSDASKWPHIPHGKPSERPCGPFDEAFGVQSADTDQATASFSAMATRGAMAEASLSGVWNNAHGIEASLEMGGPGKPREPLSQRSDISNILFEEDAQAKLAALQISSKEAMRALDKPPAANTVPALERLVRSHFFELFFAGVVFSNALLIGAEVQYAASHLHDSTPRVFIALSTIYTIAFLVELLLRIKVEGLYQLFCKNSPHWAYLDAFIVLASLADTGLDMVLLFKWLTLDNNVGNVSQLRIIRMIRITRLVRMFRIQRIVRLIAPLRTLVYSIAVTLRSLMWAMALLLIIIYVVGIVFTQSAVDTLAMEGIDHLFEEELKHYWASLDRSMYTLFQSIAGGVEWRHPVIVLEKVSYLMSWLFAGYISFVNFAVLNVVTGVFCSCAIETTQRNPEVIASAMLKHKHTYIDNLKALFHQMDEDGSGLITLSEFESLMNNELMNAHLMALEIDSSDVWTLFKLIDADKSGVIEIDEFVKGCEQLKGNAKGVDIANLAAEFRMLAKKLVRFMCHVENQFETLTGQPGELTSRRAQQRASNGPSQVPATAPS